MYRFTAIKSMNSSAASLVGRVANTWSQHGKGIPFYATRVLFALLCMITLTGCGSKDIGLVSGLFSGSGDLQNQQRPGTGYLPADTGIALKASEVKALLSTGDFDRGLSKDELRDVNLHFKHLVQKQRNSIKVSVARAQKYMPHIRKVMSDKRVPADLAYLPFVESNYNTTAVSSAKAAGMWQFIPSTGKYMGLTQNAWIDERKDPYKATKAAADYLKKLYSQLDDWHLAISAYNAGPGKIGKGLKLTGADNFFELRDRDHMIKNPRDKMTNENKQYLTKFLAVAKIMRNLQSLGFESVDNKGLQVAEVRIRPGTNLKSLSSAIGLSWKDFTGYNPGILRSVSPNKSTISIYVPRHLGNKTLAYLDKSKSSKSYASVSKPKSSATYRVRQGDSLWGIARKFNISPVALLAHNNLERNSVLKPGDTVRVPKI